MRLGQLELDIDFLHIVHTVMLQAGNSLSQKAMFA